MMMTPCSFNQQSVLLHLSLMDRIGPLVVRRILTHLKMDKLSDLYSMSATDLMHRCALSEKTARRLADGLRDTTALRCEQDLLQKHEIAWYSMIDPCYPALLKEINVPPIGIYVQGKLPTTSSTLAVVGSRKANIYGQRAIDRIIPPLCAQGTVIVSGGALGIDAMAHKAAVVHQAPTIAVLGSGLLQRYPAKNRPLFDEIIYSGGAMVSAFPLLMEALPGNFPARNRIIAGLSQGCLVVQAAKKSGALITASYILEQGREIFTIPGPIDDPLSVGCHALLRQGATLVEVADDILNYSPIFTSRSVQLSIDSPMPEEVQELSVKPVDIAQDTADGCLVALCAQPISVDEISGKLGIELFETQSRLFCLQLTGRVQQNYMGLWHT